MDPNTRCLSRSHKHIKLHRIPGRRLNIRYKDSDGIKAIATLNGTLVAIPRMIVAILENHQNADGTVSVPAALQPFLGVTRFELV